MARALRRVCRVALLVPLGCASAPAPPGLVSRQTEVLLQPAVSDGLADRALVYTPLEYEEAQRSWPLILFLHGAGERGNDPTLVRREGLPNALEKFLHFPFLVVSPQCRRRRAWSVAWSATYVRHDLYDWFLAHRTVRGER